MKARTGSLIRRASGYYIRIVIEGKVIVRALRTPEGTPCRTVVEARRAQADFIRPFALASKAEALEAVVVKLEGIRDEATPKAAIVSCFQAYLASPDRLPSGPYTLKAYEGYARRFAQWIQANYPNTVHLRDLTKAQAQAYAATLAESYNGCTHNKHLHFLRAMFRTLCEGTANPFERCRTRPADSTPHRPLTPEQIRAVLEVAKGELRDLILIGTYTGLRLKDASLLRWSDIDLDRGVITVMPSKTASRSGKTVVIPIHPELRALLSTKFQKGECVMPWVAWRYTNDVSAMAHKLAKVFRAAGINTKDSNGKTVYSFHSLRFSLGTALVSSGFSVEVVSQALGHTSTTMARHYAQVADTVKEQAILSLPSIHTA